MMDFMMAEVPAGWVKVYQQTGGSWVAEVKYRGINFICVAGKHKPQLWDEVFEGDRE